MTTLPYPDTEQVLMDLLRPVGHTVTWLPPKFAAPIIHIQRIGGGPDDWDITDYALIRLAFYGDSRNEAWTLAAQGEALLISYRGRTVDRPGTPSDGVIIDFVALDVGGMLDPDLDPDDRRVIKNFTVGCRRQYHLVGA